MISACITCNSETTKYKCPKCYEYYCSLNCYKEHTKQECQAVEGAGTERATTTDQEPTIHEPFPTEDTVERAKLENLRHSEGVRNLLYNKHLRSLLLEIDSAPNAWRAMRDAMQEPLFIEFADECLKVVEPMTEEND